MDQFCTILKQLSVNCDFTKGTVENEVKTQMICGCTSKSTRKKLVKTEVLKGHRKRFPKLVKMLVLYIKINFNQRYLFPRNKVTLVLKLALLASHMAKTLIKNLPKTSECDVIFAKHHVVPQLCLQAS